MRVTPPLVFLLAATGLPGCVVSDIHGDIAVAKRNPATIAGGMVDIRDQRP